MRFTVNDLMRQIISLLVNKCLFKRVKMDIMNRLVMLFVGVSTMGVAHGQFPVPTDSIYTFMKHQSAFRQSVDWGAVDTSFKRRLSLAKTTPDTMNCLVYVLKQLNDVHSQLYLNNQYYGHYPSFDDTALARLIPLNQRSVSLVNTIFGMMLRPDIAYIRVPGMQPRGQQAINGLAQVLYDSVAALAKKRPRGFIIDLRLNGGGNVYPMLTGLGALLGNRLLAYETDVDDEVLRTWEIKKGNFVIGGYQSTNVQTNGSVKLTDMPVVILIGPITKSSGSMTAIAFKKRPKTIFMGEPTADGYSTSCNFFQFGPNLMLNFATNFVADRDRQVYKTVVPPDITIHGGDNFDNLQEDKKIRAAIEWLTRRKRH
jgi:carboxyl-terminal processing protease